MNAKTKKPRPAQSQDSRPTIGLLITDLVNPWTLKQWQGVADAARERGVNLICFPGSPLRTPLGFDAQANVIYDLVNTEKLDGLILWTAGFDNHVSQQEVENFCNHYRPLPIVSAEKAIKGIPSALMEDYQSMRKVIVHLIEVHGCRRIAFISGSLGHLGIQERYRAYIETLTAYGLPLDPNLVYPFDKDVPNWIVGLKRSGLDAVVGCNDIAALPALRALQEQGIRVPEDMAVVGFGNMAPGRTVTPSLTTVRPPFYEMGRQMVETLLAMIDGEQVPEQMVLSGTLIVRESCGCLSPAVAAVTMRGTDDPGSCAPMGETVDTFLGVRLEHILSAMKETLEASVQGVDSGWADRLLKSFTIDLRGETQGAFITTLGEILRQGADTIGDSSTDSEGGMDAWHGVLSSLRCHVLPCLGVEARDRAEDLWHQARVLIGERAQRAQAYQMLRTEQRAVVLREISQSLATTFDVKELMDLLAQELPRLDIASCSIALYENPQPYEYPHPAPEWSRLMLAYDKEGCIETEPSGLRFRSRQLAPGRMLNRKNRHHMIVEPLYFREDQLGFALFEVGPHEGAIYEALRGQLSSALKGALLLQEHKQAKEALARSNQELEQFAYIASHDLQEPLRKVRAFGERIEARYADMLDERGHDYLQRMRDAVDRMQAMIDSLLTISRVTTRAQPFAPIDLNQVAKEVVSDLEIRIEQIGGRVDIDELPTIEADPSQMRQLLGNLIGNGLKYHVDL